MAPDLNNFLQRQYKSWIGFRWRCMMRFTNGYYYSGSIAREAGLLALSRPDGTCQAFFVYRVITGYGYGYRVPRDGKEVGFVPSTLGQAKFEPVPAIRCPIRYLISR